MGFLHSQYTKKPNKFLVLLHIPLFFIVFQDFSCASDPLSAWENSKNKTDIVHFIQESTKEGSLNFVNTEDRIAVFDNDGTLWVENQFLQNSGIFEAVC